MIIALIQDDEIEDELDMDLTAQADSLIRYGLRGAHYAFLKRNWDKPFLVPESVNDTVTFVKWIKQLTAQELAK